MVKMPSPQFARFREAPLDRQGKVDLWRYADKDKIVGPISEQELLSYLRSVSDAANVLVSYGEHLSRWEKASTFPVIASAIVPASSSGPINSREGVFESILGVLGTIGKFWLFLSVLLIAKLLGQYGLGLVAVAYYVFFIILKKIGFRRPIIPAISLTLAHGVWVSLGLVYLFYLRENELLIIYSTEAALILLLVVWILKTYSRASLTALIIYKSIGILTFLAQLYATPHQVPLYLHLLIRLIVIVLAIVAMQQLRAENASSASNSGGVSASGSNEPPEKPSQIDYDASQR